MATIVEFLDLTIPGSPVPQGERLVASVDEGGEIKLWSYEI
jgi:hypothetical protein